MLFQIHFKSGKPIYLQVVDQIKAASASGALRAGEVPREEAPGSVLRLRGRERRSAPCDSARAARRLAALVQARRHSHRAGEGMSQDGWKYMPGQPRTCAGCGQPVRLNAGKPIWFQC